MGKSSPKPWLLQAIASIRSMRCTYVHDNAVHCIMLMSLVPYVHVDQSLHVSAFRHHSLAALLIYASSATSS